MVDPTGAAWPSSLVIRDTSEGSLQEIAGGGGEDVAEGGGGEGEGGGRGGDTGNRGELD